MANSLLEARARGRAGPEKGRSAGASYQESVAGPEGVSACRRRALDVIRAVTTASILHLYITLQQRPECSDIRSVHKAGKYLSVFLLNVTVSEFHPVGFCAICWISRFREVFQLGPKHGKQSQERHPHRPVCSDASGADWPTGIACQHTRGTRRPVPQAALCEETQAAVGISVSGAGAAPLGAGGRPGAARLVPRNVAGGL